VSSGVTIPHQTELGQRGCPNTGPSRAEWHHRMVRSLIKTEERERVWKKIRIKWK